MEKTLAKLYEGCRSYRRFQQKEIPQNVLQEMLETARKRSSAMNAQPLRYVVVRTPEVVAKVQPCLRWAAKLPKEIGTPKEGEQPTAFVLVLAPVKANLLTSIDLGISLDTMAITAWQYGVGSCIIYSAKREQLAKIAQISDGLTIAAVLALGYPAHTSTIVEEDKQHGLNYYVDAERNYYVPKRPACEVIRYI